MAARRTIFSQWMKLCTSPSMTAIRFRHEKVCIPEPQTTSSPATLFELERNAQMSYVARLPVDKINVSCRLSNGKQTRLKVNKSISTPLACTLHIGEPLVSQSALALVNGKPWSMHRPLDEDCTLELLHYQTSDPTKVNEAYWKTCSYLLGYVVSQSFKTTANVSLCRPVSTNVHSGSFAYDFEASFEEWNPSQTELDSLSTVAGRLSYRTWDIIPLTVTVHKAKEVLLASAYQRDLLNKLHDEDKVTLYRMGRHVDLAEGPLIGNTSNIGRFSVSAIHKIQKQGDYTLYRIQGVSIPKQISIHYWTYRLIEENAKELVTD